MPVNEVVSGHAHSEGSSEIRQVASFGAAANMKKGREQDHV